MKPGYRILNLLAASALAGLSIYGFSLLHHRPGFPPDIDRASVIRFDGYPVHKSDELNFLLSGKAIGNRTTVVCLTSRGPETRTTVLVPYYSQAPFPVIYLIIGLINLAIGLAVFLLKPEDVLARIFFWGMVAFSCAVIISGDFYGVGPGPMTYVPGFIFHILYPLAPAVLLHFSLALSGRLKRVQYLVVYGPALILAAVINGLYLASILKGSLPLFRRELQAVYILRWYILAFIAVILVRLILRFRKTEREEEKAQIQWILYGLVIGLLPFILMYQIPRTLDLSPVLSEEVSSVFFIVIPLAFAVAIVKFKLMHIELVINRSLVYAFLTVLLVSLYLFSLELFRLLFARVIKGSQTALSLAATIVVAAAFHPAQKRVQGFVDKAFFRQSYDARQAVLKFSDQAQRIADFEGLADLFLARLNIALPMEQLHLAVYDGEEARADLRLVRGSESTVKGLALGIWSGDNVLARSAAVHFSAGVDFSGEAFLELHRVELALRLPFNNRALRGFAAFGRKKSGARYAFDDLEFLAALLAELALHLERIKLQEEVIYERASKEKLDELNKLKTEFISSVSHELRTPLSSLQGLVEILQSGTFKDASRREKVLEIMAGESNRLSRFLHNILDYGKMEQNVKTYELQETALQPLVEEVAGLFRFGGESQGVTITLGLPSSPIVLNLDRDAVKQALINLIDNAIKYSAGRKEVEVQIVSGAREVEVRVRDWGIGIRPEERDKVFDKFYRAASASRHNPQGVGLGLKIVKHIMEAHGGTVRVEPAPGQGTVFILAFPRK